MGVAVVYFKLSQNSSGIDKNNNLSDCRRCPGRNLKSRFPEHEVRDELQGATRGSCYLVVLFQCTPVSDSESHVNSGLGEECHGRTPERAFSMHKTKALLSKSTAW
jgi:hypothetical protein